MNEQIEKIRRATNNKVVFAMCKGIAIKVFWYLIFEFDIDMTKIEIRQEDFLPAILTLVMNAVTDEGHSIFLNNKEQQDRLAHYTAFIVSKIFSQSYKR